MSPRHGARLQRQQPAGSDVEPPHPAFLTVFPNLDLDSWITTPGPTTLAGPSLPGDGTSIWSDTTDDGPQTNFKFADLTLPNGVSGQSLRAASNLREPLTPGESVFTDFT